VSKVILEGSDLVKSFGGRAAVDHVAFHLNEGEILGLIGPNGAGKTTLFNLISGAITADSGAIRLFGEDITKCKPYQICRKGIGRTFQAAKNFPGMSVYENVFISAQFGQANLTAADAKAITEEVIEFAGLEQYLDKNIKDIPLAGQKRIEVTRALATRPKILLLDEVMAGLTPTEVDEAMELVRKINGSGITVIMIEHVMKAIMSVCGRIMVLHHGQNLAEGTPEEVSTNPAVIEVYLGG